MGTEQRQPGVRLITVGTFDDPNWDQLKRSIWMRSAKKWGGYAKFNWSNSKGNQHRRDRLRP